MNLFRKKESPAKRGPSLGGAGGEASPIVYRERSANNFQEDELKRLRNSGAKSTPQRQYRERVVGGSDHQSQPAKSASPQPHRQNDSTPGGADDGERDRQFELLKKQLEIALREGDSDRIIEGYRNLGQHFMSGKTLAEQQAAKQMFEKALEHAGSQTHYLPCARPLVLACTPARRSGTRCFFMRMFVIRVVFPVPGLVFHVNRVVLSFSILNTQKCTEVNTQPCIQPLS